MLGERREGHVLAVQAATGVHDDGGAVVLVPEGEGGVGDLDPAPPLGQRADAESEAIPAVRVPLETCAAAGAGEGHGEEEGEERASHRAGVMTLPCYASQGRRCGGRS